MSKAEIDVASNAIEKNVQKLNILPLQERKIRPDLDKLFNGVPPPMLLSKTPVMQKAKNVFFPVMVDRKSIVSTMRIKTRPLCGLKGEKLVCWKKEMTNLSCSDIHDSMEHCETNMISVNGTLIRQVETGVIVVTSEDLR